MAPTYIQQQVGRASASATTTWRDVKVLSLSARHGVGGASRPVAVERVESGETISVLVALVVVALFTRRDETRGYGGEERTKSV